MSKEITPESLAGESEDSQQLALLCWCSQNFEKYPELKRLTHIPNGGSRHKAEAGKLKAMGVKNGVPDLMLLIKRGHWSGIFIELKRVKGGVVSTEQKDWLAFLREQGFGAIVCYGWLEARKVLIEYLEWK